jgi:hypothetical protein
MVKFNINTNTKMILCYTGNNKTQLNKRDGPRGSYGGLLVRSAQMGGITAIKGVINVLGKVCLRISRGANLVGLFTLGLMAVLVIAGIMGDTFSLSL